MVFIISLLFISYPAYFYLLLLVAFFFLRRTQAAVPAALAFFKAPAGRVILVLMFAGLCLRIIFSSHIDFDFYGWTYVRDALAIKKIIFPAAGFAASLFDALHIPGFSCLILWPLLIWENICAVSAFNLGLSVLVIPVVYAICRLLSPGRLFAVFAAALVAFSPLHIQFSAEEIPLSASVLFVTVSFLFFILWLSTKQPAAGFAFITFFFIALNIKIENCLYIPVFARAIATQHRGLLPGGQRKKIILYSLMLTVLSAVFWLPFIINMVLDQLRTIQYSTGSQHFFSPLYFLNHCWFFLIQRTHGFAFGMLAIYALAVYLYRRMNYGALIIGWFMAGLLTFFWWGDIFSLWNMAQILIPLYICGAYAVTCFIAARFRRNLTRWVSCAMGILLVVLWSNPDLFTHYITWVDVKRNFRTDSDNVCLVAPDSRLNLALAFLFPGKQLVFLDDSAWQRTLSACQGSIYYFNPISYGLAEEIDPNQVSLREEALSEHYLMQRNSSLYLYKLARRQL